MNMYVNPELTTKNGIRTLIYYDGKMEMIYGNYDMVVHWIKNIIHRYLSENKMSEYSIYLNTQGIGFGLADVFYEENLEYNTLRYKVYDFYDIEKNNKISNSDKKFSLTEEMIRDKRRL